MKQLSPDQKKILGILNDNSNGKSVLLLLDEEGVGTAVAYGGDRYKIAGALTKSMRDSEDIFTCVFMAVIEKMANEPKLAHGILKRILEKLADRMDTEKTAELTKLIQELVGTRQKFSKICQN